MLGGDIKNTVQYEIGPDRRNTIVYSVYGHHGEEWSPSSSLGYNGELREVQSGCYLLGNGFRAFNTSLMRFHSPDSLSPFGDGWLNAYTYCRGDPVNQSDPTGHVSIGKAILNFLGLRKRSAERAAPIVTQRPASPDSQTRQQVPVSATRSEVTGPGQSSGGLPPYSPGETAGTSSRSPRLPNYDEDQVIKLNAATYEINEIEIAKLQAGGGPDFYRDKERQIHISMLKEENRNIRKTQRRILYKQPVPGSSRPITAEEQARNRALLKMKIKMQK
jgi:RHS repeat-associated protein